MRITAAIGLSALLLLSQQGVASAQTAENVAVIINSNSAESELVGEYYVQARGIPAENVIRLSTSPREIVDYATYVSTIQQPIAAALAKARLQDKVLYLVLTKGVPLRIFGTVGDQGTAGSVDSELTLLYRRMTGQAAVTLGRLDNPYFLDAREIATARRFTHRDHDIFLVSRLDGFSVEDALALVDRGTSAVTEGRIVLDERDAQGNRAGEEWLELAAKRLSDVGHSDRVLLETTAKPARTTEAVLGYYSWGSTDPQNRVRKPGMKFVPGSLAASFVSTDARTFQEPPASWVPTNNLVNRATWFGASPQSLIGDLIREGVTGVAGHVAEPLLQSAVRPEVLFPAYLAGFNLIESFYLAMPHLSWQTVVIGDPLAAPFARTAMSAGELASDFDPDTELPAHFSKRRLGHEMSTNRTVPERAVVLAVKAEGLTAREDFENARLALEESTMLAPRVVENQTALALLYDRAEMYERAVERYRRIIGLEPDNIVVLNNLAYSLAVHLNAAGEAVDFAKRAAVLSPASPSVLDTLGWAQHLSGNDIAAAPVMARAVRLGPNNGEIRLHAAIVYAARGTREAAETELKEAVRLMPELEEREETKQLRIRLQELAVSP